MALQSKHSSPATRHDGAWGERRYSSYSFLTSALDGGVSVTSRSTKYNDIIDFGIVAMGWENVFRIAALMVSLPPVVVREWTRRCGELHGNWQNRGPGDKAA
jgi:hypothetical protein